jgi:putative membrane protein
MFSKEDIKSIEAELAAAEAKTAAEFVVVIARASKPTGLLFPFLWFVIGGLLWYISEQMPVMPMAWDQLPVLVRDFVFILVSGVLSFFAMRSPRVRRFLTPDSDERRCVDEQAELQFYRRKIAQTTGQAGVLIYLSLMEHRAVILADVNALKVLDQKTLDQSLAKLIEHVRKNETAIGIKSILSDFGAKLQSVLPPPLAKKNELSNALIFL